MSINVAVISGNIAREPELKRTPKGTPILTFTLGFSERRPNEETGEWEERSNFIGCTMFGNRAEALAPYLHKGSHVGVRGTLRYSSWERDGIRRSKIEIVIDQIDFYSSRTASAQSGSESSQTAPAPEPSIPAPVPAQPTQAPVAIQDEIDRTFANAPLPDPDLYDEDIQF